MPPRSSAKRALGLAACLVLVVLVVAEARGDIVLHEYFVPDPVEDLKLGARTSDGAMAAAIETRSGPVASPDVSRPARPSPGHAVYGAGRTPPGSGGRYKIDGDTSRPDSVRYDDPFTPAIAPYKREFAYDAVGEAFDLVVHDPSLRPLAVGGGARPEDDQFYADLDVDLAAGQAVRIPTVGPAARPIAARVVPSTKLAFFRDGADNWFVRAESPGRVRLVLHVAVDRAVFGSPFADVGWTKLWAVAPPVAPAVKDEGLRVAREIGVVDGSGPKEALDVLVAHFRSFAPSDAGPSSSGLELYRDLALSKKGVCRHRAYAFVVTALALGLPARFVRNEAHAWVEVFDATRWHRIDLGGAAGHLDFEDEGRVAHVPPRDLFEWPPGSDSGQAMAERSRTGRSGGGAGRTGSTGTAMSSAFVPAAPPPAPSAAPDDGLPKAEITLRVGAQDARRGGRIPISGRVLARGGGCPQTLVDLFLELAGGGSADRVPLGALVTDDEGRYEGRVVVPFGVAPGDYDVRASTTGSFACGQGQSP